MFKHGLHFFALLVELEFSHVRLPQLLVDDLLLLLMSALEELLVALERLIMSVMSILHDGLDAWIIIIDHHFITVIVTMIEECLHCHFFASV
jgi:hypothetical protein